jgi:hypothetical protein
VPRKPAPAPQPAQPATAAEATPAPASAKPEGATATATAKEPWQMTRAEYVQKQIEEMGKDWADVDAESAGAGAAVARYRACRQSRGQ